MIHLTTEVQRSGKSQFAEELALTYSNQPVYLATSRILDEEHRKRRGYLMGRYFNKWISGYTGDCIEATQQVCEIVF